MHCKNSLIFSPIKAIVIFGNLQIDCPNERPRYICLARRLRGSTPPQPPTTTTTTMILTHLPLDKTQLEHPIPCAAISEYLEVLSAEQEEENRVPEGVVAKGAAWCFDIVTAKSDR